MILYDSEQVPEEINRSQEFAGDGGWSKGHSGGALPAVRQLPTWSIRWGQDRLTAKNGQKRILKMNLAFFYFNQYVGFNFNIC